MSEDETSALPEGWFTEFLAARQRDEDAGRSAPAAACPRLVALGVTEVRLDYDGCGDSGSVESLTATGGDQPVVLPTDVAAPSSRGAAQRAREIQLDSDSIGVVFSVVDPRGGVETIDLAPVD